MENIVDMLLNGCRRERLEAVERELIQGHSSYQLLKRRASELERRTNPLSRLNPFSNNEDVIELRRLNAETSSLERRYDSLIEEVKSEVAYAAQSVFPLQLAWLLAELNNRITNLRAKPSFWSEEWGKLHLTEPCVIENKENLFKLLQSIRALVVQHFGDSYFTCSSENDVLDAATQKFLTIKRLPIRLSESNYT